ncbi:MAG: HEAT repeat domain-containing protein [Methanoregula sp.]|nr:HEAT repeat domain-containing protein [Methanoregula sp.]
MKEKERSDPDPVQDSGESRISQEERLAHFIRMLSDEDEGKRWKAAESLGRMREPGAVESLIETLWDDDSRVRLKAAWALGRIGDIRATGPLRRLYRMENEGGREIITEAIEAINPPLGQQ